MIIPIAMAALATVQPHPAFNVIGAITAAACAPPASGIATPKLLRLATYRDGHEVVVVVAGVVEVVVVEVVVVVVILLLVVPGVVEVVEVVAL